MSGCMARCRACPGRRAPSASGQGEARGWNGSNRVGAKPQSGALLTREVVAEAVGHLPHAAATVTIMSPHAGSQDANLRSDRATIS